MLAILLVLLVGTAWAEDPLASLTPAEIQRGGQLFRANCAPCHGIDGSGGAGIFANPVSFAIDGRQHVAIAAGHALLVFGLR